MQVVEYAVREEQALRYEAGSACHQVMHPDAAIAVKGNGFMHSAAAHGGALVGEGFREVDTITIG